MSGKYRTIVADPPWPYDEGWPGWQLSREERRALPYPAMTLEEIAALDVASVCESEGYLFLWTTNRYLEDAFRIMRHWTFRPRQTLTWCKPARGKGPGGMFATNTEFILIGQRIGPRSNARGQRTLGERVDSAWFEWPRGAHSTKPDAFLDIVEQVSPAPRLEMFARRARFGWDYWGDESLGTAELCTSLKALNASASCPACGSSDPTICCLNRPADSGHLWKEAEDCCDCTFHSEAVAA